MAERAQITVTGVVQGVGFRPYVYNLADELGLRGFVSNTASGVLIEAEGERLAEFLDRLPREAPRLARIAGVSVVSLPLKGFSSFSIDLSEDVPGAFTLLSPDVSVCPDCLRELQDPIDRRYRYPFINCTNCGPRYSITRSVPYDRPNTTMVAFTMCKDCEREYHDPRDRRFHAQPNACPECGPQVSFVRGPGGTAEQGDAITAAVSLLRQGGVVAIKGLGGFHIACDAMNDLAVRRLRERRRRNNKPFAVMVPSAEIAAGFCDVTDEEVRVLRSVRRPIVLLKKTGSNLRLSDAVAPNNQSIGVMLPYTPLHMLLFAASGAAESLSLRALVMTSGNLAEEPILHSNDTALAKLAPLVDGFLLHDRDIFMRVDDSVVGLLRSGRAEEMDVDSTSDQGLFMIRRSRGYAPDAIPLQGEGPEVLGCGGDLKNTFTLTKGSWAIPSQHIGDMENYESLAFFEQTLDNLKQVYRVNPVALAHDLHPGYFSTNWAKEHQAEVKEGLIALQHHYAHVCSVMAEKGLTEKVIGVAFDGTGYGTDGRLWGGEFLIADLDGFERAGHLAYLPLPGGESAIREPWRTAVGLVSDAGIENAMGALERIGLVGRHGEREVGQVLTIASQSEHSPLASGAGRYFDAVAALLGVCDRNTFEGEAAMALEALVTDGCAESYPIDYQTKGASVTVDLSPVARDVVQDVSAGEDRRRIATRFHNTMATLIAEMAERVGKQTDIRHVVLSGGTFQNRYLLKRSINMLRRSGLVVHRNEQMPSNDACISLGQAYVARHRLKMR